MYHTEGFVNKHTMDMSKHIVMLSLEQNERPWYVWCVTKKSIVGREVLHQALSFWLQQTLLTNGICEQIYAQRELNRLGGYLQNMDPKKIRIEDIKLFMYYQGGFYKWENDGVASKQHHKGQNWREIGQGIYGYVSEESLWEQYEANLSRPEEIANALELSLVEACEKGEMEDGFFLIWEDSIDYQKV